MSRRHALVKLRTFIINVDASQSLWEYIFSQLHNRSKNTPEPSKKSDSWVQIYIALYFPKHKTPAEMCQFWQFCVDLSNLWTIKDLFFSCVMSTLQCYPKLYWKPIEIYCWNSLHQGWSSVPGCWYMKFLLPLLKVKYYTRQRHKLTILSIHTFNKFNSPPISSRSWGWHRIPWTIFMPLFIYIHTLKEVFG